jgi:hypothetical protein
MVLEMAIKLLQVVQQQIMVLKIMLVGAKERKERKGKERND